MTCQKCFNVMSVTVFRTVRTELKRYLDDIKKELGTIKLSEDSKFSKFGQTRMAYENLEALIQRNIHKFEKKPHGPLGIKRFKGISRDLISHNIGSI